MPAERILLIEDEPDSAELLALWSQVGGLHCRCECNNGTNLARL